ncbi:MAG TPA: hypothetical protein VGR73_23810 [Bryobacteraceae bacterium]|nr:hypothetical protein [Bryobacteraceae bacterium]
MTVIGLQATLPHIVTAIGGLGTAASGLVDATKVFWGGVNHIGFKGIRAAVTPLTPSNTDTKQLVNALSQTRILATLQANWMNGTDLGSQKAIAKSLIKLNLNPGNASALAAATGVDSGVLAAVAANIAAGKPLEPAQSDVFARFDLIVTALLDEAYQRSDQVYRNGTRAWAVVASVVLALAGGIMLHAGSQLSGKDIAESLLVGLLATPLAPIAKDLSTALATAVNTLQLVKK